MSAAMAAAATVSWYHSSSEEQHRDHELPLTSSQRVLCVDPPLSSWYESQKRCNWNMFDKCLKNHRPPLTLSRVSDAHVLEFLRYLDQFGKTKVHAETCVCFGHAPSQSVRGSALTHSSVGYAPPLRRKAAHRIGTIPNARGEAVH